MAIQVVRYRIGDDTYWGVHSKEMISPLPGQYETTSSFFTTGGVEEAHLAAERPASIRLADVHLLSPVTKDGDILCQGLNYWSHLEELGKGKDQAKYNVFFIKASSCICGANDNIVRPSHVRALDYEIELGLVMRQHITGPISITEENLGDYVGGLVIINDISARGVQLACAQYHKAKSYRTFGPTGPFLVLPTATELARWPDLALTLKVNGEARQSARAGDMIHPPVDTIRELAEVRDLKPGDIIATSTPGGVAIEAPHGIKALIASLWSPIKQGDTIIATADKNPKYLRPGDEVTASIVTDDGLIDLGVQVNRVVSATA